MKASRLGAPAAPFGRRKLAILALAAYFIGISAGYLFSDRLSEETVAWIGAATTLAQATLPFSARFAAGALFRIGFGRLSSLFVFLAVLVGVSPFFAIALPRIVGESTDPPRKALVRCYAAELVGAFVGLAFVVAMRPARLRWILTIHLAASAAIVALLTPDAAWRNILLFSLPALNAACFGPLDRSSLAYYYKYARDYTDPVIIASEFSPYQRIDLLQEGPKAGARRYLFLNANLFYGSNSLNNHNLFVSIMPNLLASERRRPRALVVGGGSLDSARWLAPRVDHLTVVEIDEAVPRLTRRHIQSLRGPMPENWDLVIDDGKHYLGNLKGPAFDVISVDVPIPSLIQTAMLHSRRFFEFAHSRLMPGGIFCISLASHYRGEGPGERWVPKSFVANRVMAGLLGVFKHVTVVNSRGTSFAWASDEPLPDAVEQIQARVDAFLKEPSARDFFGTPRVSVIPDSDAREWARRFEPIGEADMQIVLRMSVRKLLLQFL